MSQILHRAVSDLFPRRQAGRTQSVGIEHELLTRDAVDGSAVAIDRVRRAVVGSSYERWIGFEPGGQVELSLPCCASLDELASLWRGTIRELREDCARAGVLLDADPVDPRSSAVVPLQLTSDRYLGMQRHFDRIGPAGRRMMRQTASTQVCLDWWPGRAGWEQWRLLLLAGPFLAAAYARSNGPGSRLTTWLAVDPDRTAYDDRLLRGNDPVAAYAEFAAGACAFGLPGTEEAITFSEWDRVHGADAVTVAHHLSTLFPPVRPRGCYLEVRFLDVQPDEVVVPLTALLSRLLYDDEVRRQALRVVQYDDRRFADLWQQAALEPEGLLDRASALLRLVGSQFEEPTALVGVA